MDERRATTRARVMYGATASLPPGGGTTPCVVRNFSEGGALVHLGSNMLSPDDIALTIEQKGRSYQARVVWWRDKAAGVSFQASAARAASHDNVDHQEQLRISQKKVRQLKRRVRQLLGEE